jgi:hypothetical protein
LGSAEVTHPFHPLHGQRFAVLKVRRVSGVETLCIRHPVLGGFALPQDWTDWRAPTEPAANSLMIDAFGFAALAAAVDILTRDNKRIDQ